MEREILSMLMILGLPLISAGIIALFLRRRGNLAATVSVLAALGIAVVAVKMLLEWDGSVVAGSMEWLRLGDFVVSMGFLLDKNAATMLLVVSVVAFFIHMFSVEYMGHDGSKGRYFGALSIFMFSMLGIVLADNLVMLFIFWELVGFSSYALIAHYSETDYAAMASKKAFIVNRVGDFGLLMGIVWAYWHFGTVNFVELEALVGAGTVEVKAAIGFLLMCGFLGKSAQFPLHVWLPDAMAGPTPVSALIHAATMVAAGIYFIIRIYFMLPPEVLTLILWLGAAMTFYAGMCALGQRDIKKILAYSTLSQLGYMAVALGLGYPGLALFHLATHACFKALLFLGAGSVIHQTHHEQDIFNMGGLLKRMPVTGITFLIGMLALCGVTFTSGFYSKDAIIEGAFLVNKGAFVVVMLSALMTSIYMGRLYWIAFLGKGRTEQAQKATESGPFGTVPLVVLAVLSLTVGFGSLWPEAWSVSFMGNLESVHAGIREAGVTGLMLSLGTAAWVLGLGLTYFYYKPGSESDPLQRSKPALYGLFESKLWFDQLYNFYVRVIQQRVANILSFLDLVFLSGLVIRGGAGLVGLVSLVLKGIHVGSLHAYAYWFLAGVILFGAFAVGIL